MTAPLKLFEEPPAILRVKDSTRTVAVRLPSPSKDNADNENEISETKIIMLLSTSKESHRSKRPSTPLDLPEPPRNFSIHEQLYPRYKM